MNILIDITHPQNVHYFKNSIKELKKRHNIIITTRDRPTCIELLKAENFDFINTGKSGTNYFSLIKEWFRRTYQIYKIAKKNKIDLFLGFPGESTCIISWILRKKSISFTHCEDNSLNGIISNLFATIIYSPDVLEKDFGKKHKKIKSFNELSYLHPKYFSPSKQIFKDLNIKENEDFFIVRFVSWNAFHDQQNKGFDLEQKKAIINYLKKQGKIFISSEEKLPQELEQYSWKISADKLHDALYYAKLIIGDSQTVAIEGALLGTPAIRCNTLVDKKHGSGVFRALQNYELVYSFSNPDQAFNKMVEMVNNKNLKKESKIKQKKLLKENKDINENIINLIENI